MLLKMEVGTTNKIGNDSKQREEGGFIMISNRMFPKFLGCEGRSRVPGRRQLGRQQPRQGIVFPPTPSQALPRESHA